MRIQQNGKLFSSALGRSTAQTTWRRHNLRGVHSANSGRRTTRNEMDIKTIVVAIQFRNVLCDQPGKSENKPSLLWPSPATNAR